MKCARCGQDTPRLTLTQRYCPRCSEEVRVLTAPRPAPVARWRREAPAKDLTGIR